MCVTTTQKHTSRSGRSGIWKYPHFPHPENSLYSSTTTRGNIHQVEILPFFQHQNKQWQAKIIGVTPNTMYRLKRSAKIRLHHLSHNNTKS